MLPRSIQIQTVDFCNRKCPWCPNSKMEKSPGTLMPVWVFNKVLNDLKHAGYTGRIHPYLMAEPLCDPRIHGLIRQTRDMFPDNEIKIFTNGDNLKDHGDVQRLFDAGLSRLVISHYDEKTDHLRDDGDERVLHADLTFLRHTFYNRAGHVNVGRITPEPLCEWLFTKAYVNHRGDVILCCSDYDYEVVFGNVMESSFYDIFNSDAYNEYRTAHKEGRGKEMPLCRNCNRIK